jgi:hypothetical protein
VNGTNNEVPRCGMNVCKIITYMSVKDGKENLGYKHKGHDLHESLYILSSTPDIANLATTTK